MGASEWTSVVVTLATVIMGLIGWLLSKKDAAQAKEIEEIRKQIELLFKKYDALEAKHQDLRELVIGKHYQRDELDMKFRELGDTFRDCFKEMGLKLDKLATVFMSHVGEHSGIFKSNS
jgi:uncharacterized coiled-coil DUF342 family protein